MFKRVIVGVDENAGSQDAITLAETLMAEDGELTLAYVYGAEDHLWGGSGAAYDAVARTRAGELLEQARVHAGVEAHLRAHGSSSVGRGLHELAEAIRAHLLIIGSPKRGLLGRVHVAQGIAHALNGAPCAVAFAPAGYSQQPAAIRKIGVGYDGSPESETALGVARTLAAQMGARLSALEVVNFPTWVAHGRSAVDGTQIEAAVKGARQRVMALGGLDAHSAYGDPAEELALYGASLDLLIVGSRGYGPIGRLVHGSTAHKLAEIARCPLLVLTRPVRAAQTADAAGNGRTAAGAGTTT